MAFNAVPVGSEMIADNVQQIIDALEGVSGAGQQISFNQINSSSNYAVTIRNLDTTNGYALKVTDAADSILLALYKNTMQIGASASDNLTINAGTTTIAQGAGDSAIVTLTSSDVGHGMTTNAVTTAFGALQKYEATSGGLMLTGFKDADGVAGGALFLAGHLGEAADTTKTTAGRGIVQINAAVKSGTTVTDPGADANLLVVQSNTTTRFIFDVEGSFHADVESTTFDKYDDLALLNALDAEFQRRQDPVNYQFAEWLTEHRETLQREKIVNCYDPNGKRVMVNFTKLAMLHTGALRQIGHKLALVEQRLAALPAGGA